MGKKIKIHCQVNQSRFRSRLDSLSSVTKIGVTLVMRRGFVYALDIRTENQENLMPQIKWDIKQSTNEHTKNRPLVIFSYTAPH